MIDSFWRDESGQATTEYVLLLGIAVGFAMIIMEQLVRPAYAMLERALIQKFDQALFGANLHHFPVGRK